MYKVLVTTYVSTMHGVALDTKVIVFNTDEQAKQAAEIINNSTRGNTMIGRSAILLP